MKEMAVMMGARVIRIAAATLLLIAPASDPLSAAEQGRRVSTTFTTTNLDFPNPERGFWRFVSSSFVAASAAELRDIRDAGMTMGYAVVRLDPFRSSSLPQTFLTRLSDAFGRARAAGVKLILRFAYNYPETEEDYENAKDAPLQVVLGHIDQLAPLIAANADIVAVWQAGFIGAWGEAHTSSNNLDEPAPKRAIRDALLEALPANRLLQWRYPPDLIAWSPVPGPGGNFPRIGFHNDCFMSSPTDVGTYSENPAVRARQRAYAARLTRTTLFGGETCNIDGAVRRTSCAAILREGPMFHVTTLNRDYYLAFHRRWIGEGCFGEVKRSMGYRLRLVSASVDEVAARGEEVAASVRVRNVGWARPANPRRLELVLEHLATGKTYRVAGGDLRFVDPESDAPTAFFFAWRVPAGAPVGDYVVSVAAPDPAPRLHDRPVFAVRFANADDAARSQRWVAASATFDTGLSVRITP
jgi:hypothetical protein